MALKLHDTRTQYIEEDECLLKNVRATHGVLSCEDTFQCIHEYPNISCKERFQRASPPSPMTRAGEGCVDGSGVVLYPPVPACRRDGRTGTRWTARTTARPTDWAGLAANNNPTDDRRH
ncbi:hypothetical protein Bbelb_142690 [Branchiostoma belcheri]|nr:hypothetical protein Bbelb_142690 [Branchiostoma belcheri]